jgi:hypothetical protein
MGQIKTLNEHIDFFESIAKAHELIRHTDNDQKFFPNIDQFIQSSGSSGGIMMIHAWSRSIFIDNGSDNVFKARESEIFLLEPCGVDEYNKQNDIYQRTATVATDIMAYLLDLVSGFPPQNRTITMFQPNGTTIEPIGPLGASNCYGSSFRFSVGNPEKLDHDLSKWNFNS